MLECPYCYRAFRSSPEQIGARCPKCRMPLFEGSSKRRRPEKDCGNCSTHPDSPAVAKCRRCDKSVCGACRTRWHEEVLCTSCVQRSLAAAEPGPQEGARQGRLAWLSLFLGLSAWGLVVLMIFLMSALHIGSVTAHGNAVGFALFLFFASFVPAFMALGQALAALRLRGRFQKLATCGLVLSGTQLGLMLGAFILNLWHN